MFLQNSMANENGLILLLLVMQFISTLCTVHIPENEGNPGTEIVPLLNTGLAAPNVHNLDESDSERGEPSLNSWASFEDVHGKKHEMPANPEFPNAEKSDHANNESNDEELDDVYEVLIKDWDDEDASKNDSTSAGEEAQKESDQNDAKILNSDKNIEAIAENEHDSEQSSSSTFSINIDPNGDQIGDEITQISQNADVLSEEEAKTYAQNAKLIDHLNSGNNDAIKQMPTPDKFASKLMPTKLSRAFSKSKSLRSESAKNSSYKNENEDTSPQNEMNISSPIFRSDSFTFEQHHQKKSHAKKHFEMQSDTEPTAGTFERTPSHRRNKSTESVGVKSAEKDYLPKTEKELLVDTLNAAMNRKEENALNRSPEEMAS
uniref:Osteopontin n=1 Tax=Globodera pallida TaxID=36090 RepID=A0A183C3Z1_GLOPA